MIITNSKERIRFIRFASVGAIGAVIDFIVFNLLTQLAFFPAILASMISFLTAVVSNFTWNRLWTYPDSRAKPLSHQMIQFLIISVVGLGIRVVMFAVLEDGMIYLSGLIFPSHVISPIVAGYNLTLAFAILVVMLWNFFANRFWTYSDVY